MVLLKADWRDLWPIWRVQSAAFGRDAWDPIDLLWNLLSAPVKLKAVDGERIVGYVLAERHDNDGLGAITTIGVHPALQHRGVGRQLLTAAEQALAMPRIRLTVRPSNENALRLYAQFGYRQTRRIPRYYQGGEDGLEMEKVAAPGPVAVESAPTLLAR